MEITLTIVDGDFSVDGVNKQKFSEDIIDVI
jgi:hypothetical protein